VSGIETTWTPESDPRQAERAFLRLAESLGWHAEVKTYRKHGSEYLDRVIVIEVPRPSNLPF